MTVIRKMRRRVDDGVVIVFGMLIGLVHGRVGGFQFWDDLGGGDDS